MHNFSSFAFFKGRKSSSLTLNPAKTNILPVTRSPQPIPAKLPAPSSIPGCYHKTWDPPYQWQWTRENPPGRVITKNWNSDYATILNDLNWLPLSTRRKMRILKVCYVLNDFSCIPASSFTLHPRPSPRHPHNRIIFMPLIKTVTHKSSFFIDVIHLWNILPLSVSVSTESPSSIKSALQNYVYTHSLSL